MSLIKLKNNALDNLTSFEGSASLGDMVLVSSATASSSASIEFTSGIDSTYKEYKFFFINMHPATDNTQFTFNLSSDGGSNYNVTKTTSYFDAYHDEAGSGATVRYLASSDLAQSTAYQPLGISVGNQNDESTSGIMHLFNPADTTFVKHFISRSNTYYSADYSVDTYVAGYGNTTSAVNAISFKFVSGNIDSGKILMFGLN
tara:strand:- start:18 stop:623 length:606 start_codon:yes stop_codon:yes gene_type:complete